MRGLCFCALGVVKRNLCVRHVGYRVVKRLVRWILIFFFKSSASA